MPVYEDLCTFLFKDAVVTESGQEPSTNVPLTQIVGVGETLNSNTF